MTDKWLLTSAVFLYVMAILEAVGTGGKGGDRIIAAIYVLIAYGLMMAWAVKP